MIQRLGRWWGIEPRSQFHRQCFYPFNIAESTSMPYPTAKIASTIIHSFNRSIVICILR